MTSNSAYRTTLGVRGNTTNYINAMVNLSTELHATNRVTIDGAGYSSQFLLCSALAAVVKGWNELSLSGALSLWVHSDLATAQVRQGVAELTLVGHILDPTAPDADNGEILRRLIERFTDRSSLIEATAGYGGRWFIVAARGEERFLFHDAMGLRQVFHSDPTVTRSTWVMSQPGLARDALGWALDDQARAFIGSRRFRSHSQYRWPAAGAPFKGLARLLPNHWLDLNTGETHRYWPNAPIPQLSPLAAVDRLAQLLPGMIEAAARRFDLALGLTAGLDSRVVMAAARALRDRISFVTVRQRAMAEDHSDIVVPAGLLARLELTHHVVQARARMTPEFSAAFRRRVFLAHDHYGPDAEAILARFGRSKAVLTGSGAEIGRCSFRDRAPRGGIEIEASHLARLQRMGREPFALRHFERWLEDARDRHNVNLLDLFEWEQGHGSWLAMTQLEFDFAWRETFTPFNCRAVLTTLLGVDERYRRAPDYTLFRQVIEKLWLELLQAPINPQPTQTLLQRLKDAIPSLHKYRS